MSKYSNVSSKTSTTLKSTLFQYNITEKKLEKLIEKRKAARTARTAERRRAVRAAAKRPSGAVSLEDSGRTLVVTGDVWIKQNNHWVPLTERKMEVLCTDGYLYAPWVVLGSNTCVNNNDATKEQMKHVKTFLRGAALKGVKKRLTERFLNAKKISGLPRKLQMNIERDTVFLSRCQQIQGNSLTNNNFLLLDPFYNRDIEKEKEKTKDAKAGKVTLRFGPPKADDEEEKQDDSDDEQKSDRDETKSSAPEPPSAPRAAKRPEPPSAPEPPSVSEKSKVRVTQSEPEDDEEEIDFDEAAASYVSDSGDDLSEETLNDMDVKALMEDKHVLDMLSDSESVREMSASESDHDLRDIPVSVESDKEFSFAASSSEEDNTLASIMQHLDASGSEDEEEEVLWASTSSD